MSKRAWMYQVKKGYVYIMESKIGLPKRVLGRVKVYVYNAGGRLAGRVMPGALEVFTVDPGLIKEQVWPIKTAQMKALFTDSAPGFGVLAGGDWDRCRAGVEELRCLKAFRQRFVEKKSWEESDYYNKFCESMQKMGRARGNTRSWEEFKSRYLLSWERLYEQIEEGGYRSQASLGGRAENEIRVAVTREGEILFVDGRHRFAMAVILGLEKIPVLVKVWHEDYVRRLRMEYRGNKVSAGFAFKRVLEGLEEKRAQI